MKELTRTYSDLLSDKRVRQEQSKYEAFSRQRTSVLSKYKKVHQAFLDLQSGLERARTFYNEMKDTVESLSKNVDTFVTNRKSEGSQLLNSIENARSAKGGARADQEQNRLKELMERMSVDPAGSSAVLAQQNQPPPPRRPPPLQQTATYTQPTYNPAASPPITPRYPGMAAQSQYGMQSPQPSAYQNGSYAAAPNRGSYISAAAEQRAPYNPNSYGPVSPPAHQQYFSPPPNAQQPYQPLSSQQQQYGNQNQYGGNVPAGYVPPPPPPGPPPSQDYGSVGGGGAYPAGPGGYAQDPRRSGQQAGGSSGADPWAGLSAWK